AAPRRAPAAARPPPFRLRARRRRSLTSPAARPFARTAARRAGRSTLPVRRTSPPPSMSVAGGARSALLPSEAGRTLVAMDLASGILGRVLACYHSLCGRLWFRVGKHVRARAHLERVLLLRGDD